MLQDRVGGGCAVSVDHLQERSVVSRNSVSTLIPSREQSRHTQRLNLKSHSPPPVPNVVVRMNVTPGRFPYA